MIFQASGLALFSPPRRRSRPAARFFRGRHCRATASPRVWTALVLGLGCALHGAALAQQTPTAPDSLEDLVTVAEASEFKETSRYADVISFTEKLDRLSLAVHLTTLGTSVEGRSLPLLILSRPHLCSAEDARRSGKPVVLLVGNIHGGEVCGKEALLMLARDLVAAGDAQDLLRDLVLAVVPLYNADGNERIATDHRPRQRGPVGGVGTRQNAQGLDLNRDHVKIEAPETRALLRFINRWDPAVVIDTHTTNGSRHRYALTYAGPKHPAGSTRLIEFVRDELLPQVSENLKANAGLETFFYGNFADDHKRWETYPAWPRYGTPYRGLRNRVAILSEAYAYATFEERVQATYSFVQAVLEYVAANTDRVQRLVAAADEETIAAGKSPSATDLVPIRTRALARNERLTVLGHDESEAETTAAGEPRDYQVEVVDRFVAERSVRRPFAYLLPATPDDVHRKLEEHGIQIEELREEQDLLVEVYRVESVERAAEPFQKHHTVTVEVRPRREAFRVAAGTLVVRSAQPLGSLAVCLLEPESEDGLATWNFFDASLAAGTDFPVRRLLESVQLTTCAARRLTREPVEKKPITYELMYESRDPPRFSGAAVSGLRWLDDGRHYLQQLDGKLWCVDAVSGRKETCRDEKPLAAALSRLPAIDQETARAIAGRSTLRMNSQRSAVLVEHDNDLYHATLDGRDARRLTVTPEREELASFSPDGSFVSFVRENDLWAVDTAGGKERALTTGGTDTLRRGKADWVYFEEVFHRSWRAHWWSPASDALAFLEVDSAGLGTFAVVNDLATYQEVERTPYPKPGDPNPGVRLGVVSAAGGAVRWADLSAYGPEKPLITGVGWWPDGGAIYLCIQNRTQTWLDFCSLDPRGGRPVRLFRDETGAWVDTPSPPIFLEDGSFLFMSERSGWRHVYRYRRDGTLDAQLTRGEWEVRRVHLVDEKRGWLFFSAMKDSPLAENLYRVTLDGERLERLTRSPGHHQVAVSPDGDHFIDTWSDHATPPRVALFAADGSHVRTIDSNPVHVLDDYAFGIPELHRIRTAGGAMLNASLLKPPDFDPSRRYPVWLMTYGGPQAQTVWDSWRRLGSAWDRVLASSGVLVFRCDPRSATANGAKAAWTAYRRLGVQELKDIEEAVRWLAAKPFVDGERIGISGHSYGGFLTAYAMTHSTLFAAGIAGAPVTDWRDYDTIYTERYMGTPQDNPEGYEVTSVVKAAGNLHGRLLLLHGARDDNVHVQNSLRLVDALQRAGRQFEFMIYPGARHGIWGDHYRALLYGFIRKTVGAPTARSEIE